MTTAQPRDPDEAWDETVRDAVEKSCAEQGVPVHVEDDETLDRVARILGRRADTPETAAPPEEGAGQQPRQQQGDSMSTHDIPGAAS